MNDLGYLIMFGEQQLLTPLQTLGLNLVDIVVGFLYAAVIILVGYLVAWAIHWVIKSGLDRAGIDKWLRKNNLDTSIGFASVSGLGSSLVKWYVFLLFLLPAMDYMKLGTLTVLLFEIVKWLPKLIVSIAIILFGLVLSDFVSNCMARTKGSWMKHLNNVVKVLILVFVIVLALQEIDIYLRLAENTILILLGGLTFGLSLAFGIGFGLGFKEEAIHIIRKWRKKW
jgi:hypothetical protein